MTHHFTNISDSSKKERTSSFTSKGSITIETALAAPLFFLAVLCMVYLLEIMSIRTTVSHALKSAGRELALETTGLPIFSTSKLEDSLIHTIGKDSINCSIIADGVLGMDCSASTYHYSTGIYDLSVQYRIDIPVLVFELPLIVCEETHRVKGWNGQLSAFLIPDREQIVYVTDHGLVYHSSLNCTYLNPSVKGVFVTEVDGLRNEAGGKYYPCETCKDKGIFGNQVFVTSYGTRYHRSLECSQIKRNIHAVPLEEVHGLGGCSKCVE